MAILRAATRASALALWQTDHVTALLARALPEVVVEAVPMTTQGDQRQDVPIHSIGGKGVFCKEVQQAVLDGRADIAVHSAKDLPALTPDGLTIAAIPERGDPRDAIVGSTLADLAQGATVASGSVRRRVQLRQLRPDLQFVELRGNIATRLARLADGDIDAIVMAAAALQRLSIDGHVVEFFDVDQFVPQVGQGALAIECRADDTSTQEILARVQHGPTRRLVDAERAFLIELGGDCSLPAGAHASHSGELISVTGILAPDDGSVVVRASERGSDAGVGTSVAQSVRRGLAAAQQT